MKRLLALALALGALLSGCAPRHDYSSRTVKQGVRELMRGHECIESVSIEYLSGNEREPGVELVLDENAPVSEMVAAYGALGEFLTGDAFLAEFAGRTGWGQPLDPGGPVRLDERGPALNVYVSIGDYSTEAYYSSTRSARHTGGDGAVYYEHIYEGWPEWVWPVVLRPETLTGEAVPTDTLPVGAELLSFDFDRDGEEETAVRFGSGEASGVWMLEGTGDGAMRRELLTDALARLAQEYCAVYDEGGFITVEAFGFSYSREKAGGAGDGIEGYKLEPQVEICSLRLGQGAVYVTFDLYVGGAAPGAAELYGEADVTLYYDAELGFRVGDGQWRGTAR